MANAPATHARGPRGDYVVGRGDLTGARAVSASKAAADRQDIIDHSVRQMSDPDVPLAIVDVPGGSPYALPRYVLDAIKRAAR